ncbi:unnamed protein product [Caenorhabditis bovis]|uniref:Uncharacterized protein n=1 Tax=Caenorhabditis bovis TaxID=2654633 RepID=A0A8S1F8Q5_9PELO|nr:unnamed protein product [Caenorhabditis bovis]
MGEREVNLPQLFSDVSRTISGISNIMGAGRESSGDGSGSGSGGGSSTSSGGSSIFGNTCFKACGMEDIQFAARSAGEMFSMIKTCVLLSTIGSLFLLLLLTLVVIYFICSHSQNCSKCTNGLTLPSFFKKAVSPPTPISSQK